MQKRMRINACRVILLCAFVTARVVAYPHDRKCEDYDGVLKEDKKGPLTGGLYAAEGRKYRRDAWVVGGDVMIINIGT